MRDLKDARRRLTVAQEMMRMYREGWAMAAPYLSRSYGILALFAGVGAVVGIIYQLVSISDSFYS